MNQEEWNATNPKQALPINRYNPAIIYHEYYDFCRRVGIEAAYVPSREQWERMRFEA